MSMKTEQRQRQNVVFAAFNTVAKIEHMKNKWIDFGAWVDMIQQHYVAVGSYNNRHIDKYFNKIKYFQHQQYLHFQPKWILFDEEKDAKEEVSGGF